MNKNDERQKKKGKRMNEKRIIKRASFNIIIYTHLLNWSQETAKLIRPAAAVGADNTSGTTAGENKI